jgi:hypothetical protein
MASSDVGSVTCQPATGALSASAQMGRLSTSEQSRRGWSFAS